MSAKKEAAQPLLAESLHVVSQNFNEAFTAVDMDVAVGITETSGDSNASNPNHPATDATHGDCRLPKLSGGQIPLEVSDRGREQI
eukprot:gene25946-23418_t